MNNNQDNSIMTYAFNWLMDSYLIKQVATKYVQMNKVCAMTGARTCTCIYSV
jgi:hypothetical protein